MNTDMSTQLLSKDANDQERNLAKGVSKLAASCSLPSSCTHRRCFCHITESRDLHLALLFTTSRITWVYITTTEPVRDRDFSVRPRTSLIPARTEMAMLRRIGYVRYVRLLEAKWHNIRMLRSLLCCGP